MYAVIKTGGKQYRVARGDVIKIERLEGEVGQSIAFDQVLMVGGEGDAPRIGTPLVAGAEVRAEVLEQAKAPKVIVFKKKRRKNYRRKHGHRQLQTVLRIQDIALA
jgi:large subunit ribosomal protein L21